MEKTSFSDKQKMFAENLKSQPVQIPLQKVEPIKTSSKKERSEQISAWINSDLLEEVKLKMVKEKKKLTGLLEELLTEYVAKP